MTIGQYLNRTNKDFVKWGLLAKYYGIIGKIFRSKKYFDKSVEYLDKRWDVIMKLLDRR